MFGKSITRTYPHGKDELSYFAFVAVAYVISRIGFFFMGLHFDAWHDLNPMQFVFPEYLKNDLWRSLLYLQSQPPLYNLFLGVVMKVFQNTDTTVFAALYHLFGFTITMCMYMVMRMLKISKPVASILTLFLALAPETVLFENILLYTYPVTMMLIAAALCLHIFVQKGNKTACVAFFSLLAAIILSRSLFHLVWFVFFFTVIVITVKQKRRMILAAAGVPLLLILLVYGKNYYLFGQFSTSSWLGASFAKVTTFRLSEEERLKLAERGEISELAFIPAIQGLWVYRDKAHVPGFEKTGIPIVDIEYYPSVGNNYNNPSINSISNQYMKDALVVLRRHPGAYLDGLKMSFAICFFPAADWFIARDTANYQTLKPLSIFYHKLLFGRLLVSEPTELKGIVDYGHHVEKKSSIGLFLVAGYAIAIIFGLYSTVRAMLKRNGNLADTLTIAYLTFTTLYVLIIGNFFEVLENMRFRYLTEPLVVVLLALAVREMVTLFRRKDTPADVN